MTVFLFKTNILKFKNSKTKLYIVCSPRSLLKGQFWKDWNVLNVRGSTLEVAEVISLHKKWVLKGGGNRGVRNMDVHPYTRGYQKVLSLTWKEPEIWIYSALFFNVVPFQLHTLSHLVIQSLIPDL